MLPDCVIVFGATGFLGQNICRALAGKTEIIGFSSKAMSNLDMMPTFPARTAIVHVAAMRYRASTFDADQAEIVKVNSNITRRIFDFAERRGIKEVRMASSSAVYSADCGVMDDAVEINNASPVYAPYCAGKRWAEDYATACHHTHDINTISFRITSAYGPHDSLDESEAHVIPALIMRTLSGDPIIIARGDPNLRRDFIYAGDVAQYFVDSLHLDDTHTMVNLATGVQTSIGDLAIKIRGQVYPPSDISYQPDIRFVDGPTGHPRPMATTERVRSLLPRHAALHSLDEGLRKTIAWYLAAMQ